MEIKIINRDSKLYPQKLNDIKNPPKQLYVMGDETILNSKCLSIVGSRCCTDYGKETARDFAKEIAKQGIIIVSGMAKGIDSEAHLGALQAEGKTIAVLGSGFKHIFPDKKIFYKILENGGTIITEYNPEVEVSPQGFRDRNRIVAGLSLGIFVVEAKEKSGTGITASYARSFQRKIFCIPHLKEDKAGIGTNRLLKRGAILVTSPDDILEYYGEKRKNVIQEKRMNIEIPKEYCKIYEQIETQALSADEISKITKTNIIEVNTTLTMLELEGYIESLPGNYYKAKEA